jgi:copper transport protein
MPKIFSRIFLAAVLLAVIGGPVFAHAVLLSTDPSDGAVLAFPPAHVTLTFNEPVAPVIVRLLGSDGKPVALSGEPKASDETVSVALPPALRDGGYILSYRVISLDSHPIGGSLTFAIGAGSAVAPVAASDATRWDWVYSALRWLFIAAAFLALGGALFRALVLDSTARSTKAASIRIARAAAPVAALAAILSAGARGAQLADSSLSEFFTPAPWRIALATSTGIGLALMLAGLALESFWPRRKSLAPVAVLLASIGLGITSHAALAEPIALSFPAYVIHLVVAAFWFGALPLLAVALMQEPLASAQAIVRRFSMLAVWGVAGLILAGVLLALVQTGPDLSVWAGPVWADGGYGSLLAAKLALVAIVLVLAIRNKRSLTPLLMRRKPQAPALLRRAIAWEGAAMVAIIALAAALGSSVPPRSLAALEAAHHHHGAAHDSHAADPEGAVVEVVRNGVQILLEADPATLGPNTLSVHFFDEAKGVHLAPLEVTIGAALPSSGIEPLRRPAVVRGDGSYRVEAMPLTVPGVWEIKVEALVSDFDKLIATIELPIGTPKK